MEDQSSLLDVLPECSVCFDKLDVTSRVLPCQHTFCMRCLQQILDARNELRCPECREHVPVRQVTELPTNILLVRILDGLKRPTTATSARPKSTSPPGSRTNKHGDSSGNFRTLKNSSSPQPCAKALYKYEAQEPMDLSFAKGDTILLRRKIDDNWFQGELNGTVGFFPASYVTVLTPLPPEPPQCKALYDFEVHEQDDKDCLTFLKDEVLKVIRRIDANWVEGQRGDKIGIFPLSFVELNGSAQHLIESQAPSDGSGFQAGGDVEQGSHEASGSSKTKSSNKRHSFTSLLTQKSNKEASSSSSNGHASGAAGGGNGSNNNNRHSMEISSPVLVRSSNPTAANLIDNKAASAGGSGGAAGATAAGGATQGATNGRKKPAPLTISGTAASNDRPPNSPTILTSPTAQAGAAGPMSPKQKVEVHPGHHLHHAQNIFVAMYSYKPQKADELELRKNEFYTVNEKCKDGWFKGMSLRTGELGVFPGNYMQPYRHDRQDRQRKSSTTASSNEPRSTSPLVNQSAGSPRQHLTTGSPTTATTTSPTSQAAPVVWMRSPGTAAPTNSATTQTPLSGMTTSTSSTMLRGAAEGLKVRPSIIAVEGQKTIAQLQNERAQQLMQYYAGNSQTQNQQGSPTVPNRVPSSVHQERPRGSPPPVQQGSGSPRSTPTQQTITTTKATLSGHSQHTQCSKTVAGAPRGAPSAHSAAGGQSPTLVGAVNSGGARTKTCAQLAAGSPPDNVSASQLVSRTRGPSVTEVPSEGHSNGQTTVVNNNSSSMAVLRNSPSNAHSPGQQVVKQSHTASAKSKRYSAHIPLTALHAVDIRLQNQKQRRYSDSDHNPNRPRIITTRSILQGGAAADPNHPTTQCKHAGVTASNAQQVCDASMPVSPPIVPVRDSASMLPAQFVTKVEKRDKRDKKSKRVPRPTQLPSDEPTGNPATQVRTNSLPENQVSDDPQQRRRSQNLDSVVNQGATSEGASQPEEGAVGGAVNGASGVPPKTTPLIRERFRVVVPYPPQSEAELELKLGDTVYVHNKRSDGWFKGTLERTGRTGLFPSTFVESF